MDVDGRRLPAASSVGERRRSRPPDSTLGATVRYGDSDEARRPTQRNRALRRVWSQK